MGNPKLKTVGEYLYWAYANLGMAHAAVVAGDQKYGVKHFSIRSRLYAGLRKGTMNLGDIVEDERLKMILPQACCYCGSPDNLSADHLIPTSKDGPNSGDNLVWACQSCNSSKGATDVLVWLKSRNEFPSLLLLRRYLKLVISTCQKDGIFDIQLDGFDFHSSGMSFDLMPVPKNLPQPSELDCG